MSLEWRLNNKWCGHFTRAFIHNSKNYFHCALRKYGKDTFTYEVIEECNNDKLDEREIYWIAYYKSNQKEFGYNQTSGGASKCAKYTCSSKRMTTYNKTVAARERQRCNLQKQSTARWNDAEIRQHIIAKMRGHKLSAETKIKMSNAQKGKRLSTTTKLKLAEAAKGNKNVKNRKYVHKNGVVKLVKIEELQIYIDDCWSLGRGKMLPMSEQGRQNISNALRRYHENKK
jgi:hypothetical protein